MKETDDADAVTQQWLALLQLLRDFKSCVLYHMENHYCLIFAARSWYMDAGVSPELSSRSDNLPFGYLDYLLLSCGLDISSLSSLLSSSSTFDRAVCSALRHCDYANVPR